MIYTVNSAIGHLLNNRVQSVKSLTFWFPSPPQQFHKRLNDYEPRFTEATDTAYKLCKDPAFSNEQNRALRNDAEDCEKKWDDVLDKVKDRMDR